MAIIPKDTANQPRTVKTPYKDPYAPTEAQLAEIAQTEEIWRKLHKIDEGTISRKHTELIQAFRTKNMQDAGKDTTKEQRYADDIEKQREYRAEDIAKGRERGMELFTPGALGRVDDKRGNEISDIISKRKSFSENQGRSSDVSGLLSQRQAQINDSGRSSDIAGILAKRKDQLAGMTPDEMNAYRTQNLGMAQKEQQGQLRNLRAQQANAGVRGPAAVAQRNALLQSASGQNASNERDLFLKSLGLQREGLDKYEASQTSAEQNEFARRLQSLGAYEGSLNSAETNEFTRRKSTMDDLERSYAQARADELARQQFNIGQQNKETFGVLSTELGYAEMGAAERAALMQKLLGETQAAATIEAAK